MALGKRITMRLSPPVPTGGGGAVIYEFGQEESTIEVMVTNEIVSTQAFRGRGGYLLSASYTRLPNLDNTLYLARLIHYPSITA